MIKVCKFGGTAMADARCIDRVAEIVASDSDRKGIVLSAPGARYNGDIKITDLLYQTFGDTGVWQVVRNRFDDIVKGLQVDIDIDEELNKIYMDINNGANVHYIVSRGEYLVSKIFAMYVGYQFVDAKDVIMLDGNGDIDLNSSRRQARMLLNQHINKGFVVPGFYGSFNNQIRLLGRGGSDISGAIVSHVMAARQYENWTDVDGFFRFDPKFGKSKLNSSMTYKHAIDLAQFGATVLHPDSCVVASIDNTPIVIKNTFSPDSIGTVVSDTSDVQFGQVIGVGSTGPIKVLNIQKLSNTNQSFVLDILHIIGKYDICTTSLMMDTNQAWMVLCDTQSQKQNLKRLRSEIKKTLNDYKLSIHQSFLIKIVGTGVLSKALEILNQNKIKPLYTTSTQDCNILAVSPKDYNRAMEALYGEMSGKE